MTAGAIIAALALFQLKHYLADFQWQSNWMVENKGQYGHLGGLAHSGLHGALSLPVLVLAAPWMPGLFVVLILSEMVLHYHVDWAKSWISATRGIGESHKAYWQAFGIDQAAHHLTNIAMIAVIIAASR